MKTKHFINLTNGIERIPELKEKNIDYSFIRLQSTTIENKSWFKLMYSLDDNLLMWLSLGYTCYLYDYGTNRPESKTIYYGVPLIKYFLERYWLNKNPKSVLIGRGKTNEINYLNHLYERIFIYHEDTSLKNKNNLSTLINLKRKYKYFRKYLNTNEINLIGISKSTDKDGEQQFYNNILS